MFRSNKKKATPTFRHLFNMLVGHWPQMAPAALLMGVLAATNALYAFLVGPMVETLFTARTDSTLHGLGPENTLLGPLGQLSEIVSALSPILLGSLIIGVAFVKGIALIGQRALVIDVGQRVLADLRAAMVKGVLHTPTHQSPNKETAGEIVSRFTVDAQEVEQAVTSGAVALLSNLLQAIALLFLAISLSWRLAIVGIGVFPLVAFTLSRLAKRIRGQQIHYYEAFSAIGKMVEETLRSHYTTYAHGLFEYVETRFEQKNRQLTRAAYRAILTATLSSPINELLGATALGGTLYYAHQEIAAGRLTASAFISFFTALFLLYRPIKGIGIAIESMVTGSAALTRLLPIISRKERPHRASVTHGGFKVEGITAGYDGQTVLHDLSLSGAADCWIAVMGSSGAGKTTLIHILAGLIRPGAGHVETPWPVSLVDQVPFLFDDTIYNNVRCVRPDASEAAVTVALEAAGVTLFAHKLPKGVHFVVGPEGSNLSAGERQRVALARAVLADTSLVLLDEATAALDEPTEELVLTGLKKALNGRCVVVVTHRPGPARLADVVITLENGRIVQRRPSP